MSKDIIELIAKEVKKRVKVLEKELPWFWEKHILVVVEMVEKLCEIIEADKEICLLSAYLHDIGRVVDMEDNHDVAGLPIIEEILSGYDYPRDKIEKVKSACRSHRCKDVMPKTIEAKVIASADAMSHLDNDFYFRLLELFFKKMSYDYSIAKLKEKVERDFNDKIFFKKAKKMVKDKYEAWIKILA